MEFLNEYFKVIQFVMWAVFAVIVFALTATFPKKKDHSELAGRVKSLEETYTQKDEHNKLAKRVTTTEVKVEALPTISEIHKVALEMKEMAGKFEGVETQLKNLNSRVGMLFENELNGSK